MGEPRRSSGFTTTWSVGVVFNSPITAFQSMARVPPMRAVDSDSLMASLLDEMIAGKPHLTPYPITTGPVM